MLKIIIASGPVIVEDGKVLLNKHGEDDFWKFCGGRVENYEFNIKETAEREVKEEMGLEVEILQNESFFFYTEKNKERHKISVILAHFLAKRKSEVFPGQDIREWKWINLKDLDKENLAPNIKPALQFFKYIK